MAEQSPNKQTPNKRAKPLRPLPVDEASGVIDEVQAWFLAQAERDNWVYTSVLRQLVNRMYRDRDYQEKRKVQGKRTAYDYALDRDQKALSWAIRALVRHVPPEEKQQPEPPKKPAKPAHRLSLGEKQRYAGRPSWNHRPKRDWDGPELPPSQEVMPPSNAIEHHGESTIQPAEIGKESNDAGSHAAEHAED